MGDANDNSASPHNRHSTIDSLDTLRKPLNGVRKFGEKND